MADGEGNDSADSLSDQRPSSPDATTAAVAVNEQILSRRESRHTSMLGTSGVGGGFGGGISAGQMKELMNMLSSINSQMQSMGSRIDSIEQQHQSSMSMGVIGAGGGGGGSMTAPISSSPYRSSPYRQPLPSSQQRFNQLRGPSADMSTLSVFGSVSSASPVNNTDGAENPDGRRQSSSRDSRGEETKESVD